MWKQKPPPGTPLIPGHPQLDGLICWLLFQEGSGDRVYDLSGNDNICILNNFSFPSSISSGWNPSRIGRALTFNGADNYGQIAHNDALELDNDNFTISIWIYPHFDLNAAAADSYLIFKSRTGVASDRWAWIYKLDSTTDKQQFAGFNAGGALIFNVFSTETAWEANTWYHLVLQYDGINYTFYRNGIFDGSTAEADQPNASNSTMDIGYNSVAGIEPFDGQLDDIRIYNRILTEKEIGDIMMKQFAAFLAPFMSKIIIPAPYVAPDPLIVKSRKRRRRPTFSVFIERQGSVTANVKNITFNRRITDSLHEPGHGSGTVVLEDSEGELIQNGKSLIKRNDKIKIWAGFSEPGFRHGDLTARFTGIVKEPTVSASGSELSLNIQDYGYLMKQAQTSGDFSAYNTPKLLVDELLSRLDLPAPEWENETGLPTTYVLGNTSLSRRNYWAIAHGVLLGISYVYYFDADGVLQCKRRDHSEESEALFRDREIKSINHVRMAELINVKGIELGTAAPVPWSATASDSLRWGQSIYTMHDKISQALYGESADYESEETVSGWDNILPFGRDSVKRFSFPRQIYETGCPAHPYLDLMQKIRVSSERHNIHGQMTIIGLSEYISASNYNQTLDILNHRELY